jgi:hypothetical protein
MFVNGKYLLAEVGNERSWESSFWPSREANKNPFGLRLYFRPEDPALANSLACIGR